MKLDYVNHLQRDIGNPLGLAATGANMILGTVAGVAQLIQSQQEKAQAKRLARNNVRPTYRVGSQYVDNYRLSESMASQGISDQAMAAYDRGTGRVLTTSIDAMLRSGSGINSISDVYETAADDYSKVAILEDEVRRKNAATYMDAATQYAAENEKAWQINEYAPYKDRLREIEMLNRNSNADKWAGANTIVSGLGNFAMGNLGQAQAGGVFGKNSANPGTTKVNSYIRSLGDSNILRLPDRLSGGSPADPIID